MQKITPRMTAAKKPKETKETKGLVNAVACDRCTSHNRTCYREGNRNVCMDCFRLKVGCSLAGQYMCGDDCLTRADTSRQRQRPAEVGLASRCYSSPASSIYIRQRQGQRQRQAKVRFASACFSSPARSIHICCQPQQQQQQPRLSCKSRAGPQGHGNLR